MGPCVRPPAYPEFFGSLDDSTITVINVTAGRRRNRWPMPEVPYFGLNPRMRRISPHSLHVAEYIPMKYVLCVAPPPLTSGEQGQRINPNLFPLCNRDALARRFHLPAFRRRRWRPIENAQISARLESRNYVPTNLLPLHATSSTNVAMSRHPLQLDPEHAMF